MSMRGDGLVGFPGGLVDEGETLLEVRYKSEMASKTSVDFFRP